MAYGLFWQFFLSIRFTSSSRCPISMNGFSTFPDVNSVFLHTNLAILHFFNVPCWGMPVMVTFLS